jgi:hypothetical protein
MSRGFGSSLPRVDEAALAPLGAGDGLRASPEPHRAYAEARVDEGKEGLVAAFVRQARHDAKVYAGVATVGVLALAVLWPSLGAEARLALVAAAFSIPANASLRLNGTFATTLRRFALAYLPDTCIRPFLLLGGVVLLIVLGVTLTASTVTFLLTLIFTGLAATQYALLAKDMPKGKAPAPPKRLLTTWRREATPLILVALFTYFFADVAILMVTPLLSSADTAAIGLCLKLALLVGFAAQVAHQVVVPDLADARARKDHDTIRDVVLRALAFPLAITLAATVVVALWGERLFAIFGPEFTSAKSALVILMGCQLARAIFGPSVPLVTVIGAQKENAAPAVAALIVLGLSNLVLAPLRRTRGRDRGRHRDAVLARGMCRGARPLERAQDRRALSDRPARGAPLGPGLGGHGRAKLDRARLLDLLLGLLGPEQSGEQEPGDEGSDREKGYGGENLAEMEGHRSGKVLANAGTVAKSTPPINLALPPLLA